MRLNMVNNVGALPLTPQIPSGSREAPAPRRPVIIRLRWRLIVLTLFALAPAVILFLNHAAEERERLMTDAQALALRVAQAWAGNHDSLVREAHLLLQAATREIPTIEACGDVLREMQRRNQWYSPLTAVDPTGAILCTTEADEHNLHRAGRVFVDTLFRSHSLEVSEFQLDAQNGSVAFAGLRANNSLDGRDWAAIVELDLAEIQRRTAREAGGIAYDVTVVARNGVILARDPEQSGLLGTFLGEHPLMPGLGMRFEGAATGRWREGMEQIFAFTQLPQTGAKVIVGLARQDVVGEQESAARNSLMILGAVAVLTLVAAWFLAELAVVRWVGVLGRAADAFRRGDLSHRALVPAGAGEFAALAAAFNRMAEELDARETALAASEHRFRDMADVASDFFWERDPEGFYTHVSEHFSEVTGLQPSDVLDKSTIGLAVAHEAVEDEAELAQSFQQRRAFRDLVISMAMPSGETRWWRISGKPIIEETTGDFRGFRGTARDITAAKLAQDELRLAKEAAETANRTKSEFLGTMSHELRTPLNAVIGFSEIITKEMFGAVGNPLYKDYAGDILASGQHLLSIINEILDFAKAEAGKLALNPENVDQHSLLTSVCRLMQPQADEAELAIEIKAGESSDTVWGDERRLRQILLNLLSNAIKFTPAGGRIVLSTARYPNEVRIVVRDTGIGMSQEDLARVTEPFYQAESGHSRRHQGTGLGLAVCDRLIRLHGGKLELTSRIGHGTTATIILPAHQAPPVILID